MTEIAARRTRKPRSLLATTSVAACLLAGCSAARAPGAGGGRTLPPADHRFLYEGRFDFADPEAPVVIWQASRISIEFSGNSITLLFSQARGQNFFNARVDGAATTVAVPEGPAERAVRLAGLGPGRHRLTLAKRSEASAGTARFHGVRLPPGAQAWRPAPPAAKAAMEFIGDSITVGACVEDGELDQWEDRSTHDNALSYASLTAAALSADDRNIAVSGMGIAAGWNEARAGAVWDRLYPRADSPPADLRAWTPDVVLVNLGENDDSFTRAHGRPFPAGFEDGYVSLVRAVRAAYPKARIVLLLGGMYGGAQSAPLRRAWGSAVERLEAGDPGVSHFVFTHWSKDHPRARDARALADELIGWLKRQDFMRPYL
ncbi:MAG: hypothetical protein HY927_10985 [Elusimicrobia bacterium]|nr:hypothetical protein [Elusimicrobiota bacterium]